MIAGIHPLLNHAVTQIVKPSWFTHICLCVSVPIKTIQNYKLCIHDCRHSSITQSCDNTWFTHVYKAYILLKSIPETLLSIYDCRHSSITQSCGNTNCDIHHDSRIYAYVSQYQSKRSKITNYVYMIAGIHPLLNHAITHDSLMYT